MLVTLAYLTVQRTAWPW